MRPSAVVGGPGAAPPVQSLVCEHRPSNCPVQGARARPRTYVAPLGALLLRESVMDTSTNLNEEDTTRVAAQVGHRVPVAIPRRYASGQWLQCCLPDKPIALR